MDNASRDLSFYPLTPHRWADFERLFGPRGACGGCWCMFWKLSRTDFERMKGEGNRQAQKSAVDSGEVPGLLAYRAGEPVAWCAVAPRSAYPGLARSRILKPLDDEPVWSITCFFVAKDSRRSGLTVHLLRAAVDYVARHGGRIVEGYPTEPRRAQAPPAFVYTGLASAFRQAGFLELARRSETRPIFRCVIRS